MSGSGGSAVIYGGRPTGSALCAPRCESNGVIGPGAVLPVSLVLQFPTPISANYAVLDALVTVPIPAGTALGFRLYPHTAAFNSASCTSLVFVTLYDCIPGDFVRLMFPSAPGSAAMVLQRLRFSCATGATPSRLTVATTSVGFVPASDAGPYNVYIFTVTRPAAACGGTMVGVAAIAAAPDASLPPPCVLPCQFAIVPNGIEDGEQAIAIQPSPGASGDESFLHIPDSWVSLWQWLKYGTWALFDPASDYDATLFAVESVMYVAATAGALVPVAVRPHAAGDAWTAQVAFVVTTPLTAGSTLAISAQIPEGSAVPVPFWLWTAPADAPVCPGTVLAFSNLAVTQGVVPQVSRGSVQRAPFLATYAGPDLDLTDFTVFAAQPCLLQNPTVNPDDAFTTATVQYVTALFTCARGPDAPLPHGLVAGVSMPAAPWPGGPMVLPPLKAEACWLGLTGAGCPWRAKGIVVASMPPVRWCCGVTPLPCFT